MNKNPTCEELLDGVRDGKYTTAQKSMFLLIRDAKNYAKVVAVINTARYQLSYKTQFPISGFVPEQRIPVADVKGLWDGIQAFKSGQAKQPSTHSR